MTITAQTAKSGPYNGNGSTTSFDYAFKVADQADLVVTVLSADGTTETIKTLTTDYTVSGVGNPAGGSIAMVVAPVTGEKLTITRAVSLDQEVDLQNRGSVNPETLEQALDKLTQVAQDQQQQLDRSLKVDLFETADLTTLTTNVNAVAAIASDVSTVSGISSNVTTVAGISADVSTVAGIAADVTAVAAIDADVTVAADNLAAIIAAPAQATAAATSATNAAASETAAAGSASAAASSFDSFDDRYLGAKASDPTVDNDGDALLTGALYWNTSAGVMRVYDGSVWGAAYVPTAGLLQASNNLSDLASAPTARSNLGLGSAGALSNRNKIINGNFDIWQRGTSGSTGYVADRWTTNSAGSTAAITQQAFTLGQTDVPGEPEFFHRMAVTSVAGAGNNVILIQRVEDVRTLAGQTATLSFWAKADAAKNIAVEFVQEFGTGGSPSSTVSALGVTTIALTTAWQKFTVTVALPSISGKTIGTAGNDTLILLFWLDAGSDFNARTNTLGQQSGTFDIAQVQLEAGDTATDFEHRPYGQELALCQRYFQTYGVANNIFSGNVTSGSAYYLVRTFIVPMRTAPTIVQSNQQASGFPLTDATPVISAQDVRFAKTANTTVNGGNFVFAFTASAEL